MLETIRTFLAENWVDLALILVGLSALLIYWLQERRKVSEEAALIVSLENALQPLYFTWQSFHKYGIVNYTFREGVASATGVASQHPGSGLACFKLRDSSYS